MNNNPSMSQSGAQNGASPQTHGAHAAPVAPNTEATVEIMAKKYKPYDLKSFRKIPEVQKYLSAEQIHAIEVVSHVFPFKTNNYVVEELIDWSNFEKDPMFVLNFPQKHMLKDEHFDKMAKCLKEFPDDSVKQLEVANEIRRTLNPHPAGQMEHNVPDLYGQKLPGMQHKYKETALFFPSQGQTCHAYCTFCFRWPQFVGLDDMKFAMKEVDQLVTYLQANPQITDVLFTGGDPMVMKAATIRTYVQGLLDADLPNLRTIRFGTKSLTYWPYKFVTDPEAHDVLDIFRDVVAAGKQLAIMAHFNHPVELSTPVVKEAVRRINKTGAVIRSQTPLLRNINDNAAVWERKWRKEAQMGIIPYYMFVVRDTGAQDYFGVPLVEAHKIFREAYTKVSGLCRTVRGPSMSADPGKVEPATIKGEKVLVLRFLQGRNPDWVGQPFFAQYDEKAIWLNDLKPAFGETEFFYEPELRAIYEKGGATGRKGYMKELKAAMTSG
jgi:KamA family protein